MEKVQQKPCNPQASEEMWSVLYAAQEHTPLEGLESIKLCILGLTE